MRWLVEETYRRNRCGVSRKGKDATGALLRELGVVPAEIEFEPRFPEAHQT